MNKFKGLKIASLNINSIIKHIDELQVLLENSPIDILAINESKIDDTVSDDEIHINGYNIIRNDRNRNGGGVLMYIRKPISFAERKDLVPDSLEIICVEIKKPYNKSFLVCAWYRPPSTDINLFDKFEAFLHKCDLVDQELLIMGDLNCDVSKFPLECNARRLQFLSSLYQLDQLINEPTRVTKASATLIDLFFTNKRENILQSGVVHLGISDHSLIYAVRKFSLPKSRKSVKIARNFKNFRANDFLNDILQIPWHCITSHDNPNVCWKIWQSLYVKVLDMHAPIRHTRIRTNSHPWINRRIKEQMRLRDFYKKQAVKHSSQTHWNMYRKTRNDLNFEMRLAKKKYFCDKINACAETNNPKKSWSLINDLLGKRRKSNNITELCVDDVTISEDASIAETFNDFFVDIGSKLASEIDTQWLNENNADSDTDNNTSHLNTLFKFRTICEQEVITELNNLSVKINRT